MTLLQSYPPSSLDGRRDVILRPLLFLSAIFSCPRLMISSPVRLPVTLLSSGIITARAGPKLHRANNELRGFERISIVPCIHAAQWDISSRLERGEEMKASFELQLHTEQLTVVDNKSHERARESHTTARRRSLSTGTLSQHRWGFEVAQESPL